MLKALRKGGFQDYESGTIPARRQGREKPERVNTPPSPPISSKSAGGRPLVVACVSRQLY